MDKMLDRPRLLAGALLVIICTFAAYLPALRNGFVWDDDAHVTHNPMLRSLDGLRRSWLDLKANCQYYPLTFSLFHLEYTLWGLHPVGYHAVSVLLHACNAILLWRVLRRIGVPGSWFAALLFALHPIEVESVAWITEQKNTLSGLLALAALWFYLRFDPLDRQGAARSPAPRRWSSYGLSLGFFTLAILSKSAVGTLPGVLLVLHWWKRPRLTLRDLVPLVPFVVLAMTLALNTARIESEFVDDCPADFARTPLDRLIVAGRALWFYAGKLALPAHLAFIYQRWSVNPGEMLQWVPLLAAGLLVGALVLLRDRLGKAPLAAILCYGGVLFPALGFANIYFTRFSYVADHFQYHAGIALLALFAALAAPRSGLSGRWALAVTVLMIAVLTLLGCLTWSRCLAYHDSASLWTDTLAKNPNAWMAHTNLANVLDARGDTREELWHHRKRIELTPDDPLGYLNLGCALFRTGEVRPAIATFERGLHCPVLRTSERAQLANNLGSAHFVQGELDQAIAWFRQSIAYDPAYADAHSNLGGALCVRGRLEEAIAELKVTLRLNPRDVEARAILEGIRATTPGDQAR
ncbi:MAG: tetratricopeptide repeat protein [Isosphaeraceae bacterium]